MTDHNTTMGRVLAMRLAASDDPGAAHELIAGHLAAYLPDDAQLILATALETITTFIVRPGVDDSEDPDAYRAQYRTAADRIAVGPPQEGTES